MAVKVGIKPRNFFWKMQIILNVEQVPQNPRALRPTGWRKTVKLRCVAWRRFQSIRLVCEIVVFSAAVSTLFKLASQFSTVRSWPEGIDKYNKGDRAAAIEFGKVGVRFGSKLGVLFNLKGSILAKAVCMSSGFTTFSRK